MVEFGLKLADNKVAEWSDYYIRYEKLKQILLMCEQYCNRYNELSKKDPKEAYLIRQQVNNKAQNHRDKNSERSDFTEQSPLLYSNDSTINKKTYEREHSSGSEDSLTTQQIHQASIRSESPNYWVVFAQPWERQVEHALLQLEKHSAQFDKMLLEDVDTVNMFYNGKLGELEERLKFLRETVAASLLHRNRGKNSLFLHAAEKGTPYSSREELIDAPLIPVTPRSNARKGSAMNIVANSLFLVNRLRTSMAASVSNLDLSIEQDGDGGGGGAHVRDKVEENDQWIREVESIQRALVDQYRSSKLLHNYAIMNYTAFIKILKKHEKVLPKRSGKLEQATKASQICDEGKAVEDLSHRLEKHYATWFCGGNHSEARAQMLPKKGDGLEMDWSQLRLGYRLGMCTILALWLCWDCFWGVIAEGSTTIGERAAFPVFRACGGLLALQWFWGISTWVWSRYRINYIYLFDFDPRIVESPLKIFNESVDHTLVYLIHMLLYYKAGGHDIIPDVNITPGIFPFLLVIYTMLQLVVPFRTRWPMWITIARVVTAPLTSPSFYHGYVGDVFTSMVKVFQDLVWTIFFVFSGDWLISEDSYEAMTLPWSKSFLYKYILIPLVTLLPLWFRFNQCLRRYTDTGDRFPHLANAFKYALSQTVTLFGAFHPLYLDMNKDVESNVFQLFWMSAFICSSLYSFVWDVYMDWGLGGLEYSYLGPLLMYPKKGFYYAVIGVDLVLRFAWVLTLIPPGTGAKFALPPYLAAVSMILELARRTLWGFLRLENEHRSNAQGYRRVGFVPLHFSTGHVHEYKQEREHRGFSVLLEVAVIIAAVLFASFGSVVVAQKATERAVVQQQQHQQQHGQL